MIYNEEEWAVIKKASPHYESAKKNWIRNAPSWLTEDVKKVYEKATGKRLSGNINCATCVLNIYKAVGKTYFSDLAEREELEKIKVKENAENNDNKAEVDKPDDGDKDKDTPDTGQNKKKLAKRRNNRLGKE